jgi:ABC-type branched-subunit amino acid transport system substrate-binding protein
LATAGGAGAAQALYFLGLDDAAAGKWVEAGERWQSVVKGHPGSGWDRLAQYKTAEALEQVGDLPRAFVQYQALISGTAVADLPERGRAAAKRLAESMPLEGLRKVAQGNYANEEFRAPIQLRLVEGDLNAGLTETARAGLEAYLLRYPTGPGQDKADELSRRLDELAAVAVDPLAIGLIVPKAGPLAPYGLQLRQGVELALAAANQGRAEAERFKLIVADEGATTQAAYEAARGLVEKDKVLALLGPLSSEAARGLLPLLAGRHVPLFSPSASKPDLAGLSPWFFRNTLIPPRQAAALADYAVIARKLTRVASLAPDSAYGLAMAEAFDARVAELGGTVPKHLSYAAGTRDFKAEVLALGGVDPSEAKNASEDEKRDQQAKVEEASTALGRYLLAAAQALTVPAGVTTTPRLRVAVVDFAEDTAAAELMAGRAFSDRFARTLAQLPELEIVGPQATGAWLAAQHLSPSALSLPNITALGQALNAPYVLGGGAAEFTPEKPRRDRSFSLLAQVWNASKAEVGSSRRFTWSKYRPPQGNQAGLQALFVPASADDLARLLPTLAFCELDIPLLGTDQWDRPELQQHLTELEGAVFSAAYWADSPDPAVQKFDSAYRAAYAARPGLLAAQAYDAATLVLQKAAEGAKDRNALRTALARTSKWEGVTGRTSFDGQQDAVKRPALIRIHDGALAPLKEP